MAEAADGLRVWSLTTGEAGLRQQAGGLAAALSGQAEEHVVRVSRLWAAGLPKLLGPGPPAVSSTVGRLEPPWPEVLVSCGRRSALVALAIRRRNPAPMVMVHIQPPPFAGTFDLIVTLPHDRLRAANVLQVETALHGVSPGALAVAALKGDPRFSRLPRPWTGLLLGGTTRRMPFTIDDAQRLADQLDAMRSQTGGSLLVTPSRRTPANVVAALGARYVSDRTVRVWDGHPPNPYLAILALSDELVVTSDSVSMLSEALATSAPVSVFLLPSRPRHRRFVEHLIARNLVSPLEAWRRGRRRQAPVDATKIAALAVRALLDDQNRNRPRGG